MPHDPRARRNGHNLGRLTREQALIALALRKLFWQAHGRQPGDDEFIEWADKQDANPPIDPYAILTAEEIAAFDEQNR